MTLHTVDTNDLLVAAGSPIRQLTWNHGQNTEVEVRQSNGTSLACVRFGNGGVFNHINSNGGAFLLLFDQVRRGNHLQRSIVRVREDGWIMTQHFEKISLSRKSLLLLADEEVSLRSKFLE